MAKNADHAEPQIRIRPESPGDVGEIRSIVAAAFAHAEHSAPPVRVGGPPGEVDLIEWLREDDGWLPDFALVALVDDCIVGHVICTRAHVDDAPALGLGPLSVHPRFQGRGVGAALVRDVLSRAGIAGETLVALLGEPAYYSQFGFVRAEDLRVEPPRAGYGIYFQAAALCPGDHPKGKFRYAAPFDRL